jgi:hypothetical protein
VGDPATGQQRAGADGHAAEHRRGDAHDGPPTTPARAVRPQLLVGERKDRRHEIDDGLGRRGRPVGRSEHVGLGHAVQQPRQRCELGELRAALVAPGQVGLDARALVRGQRAEDQGAQLEPHVRRACCVAAHEGAHGSTPRSARATRSARRA